MAQRQKSAAQIAEENGQLNDSQILNTALINCLAKQTEELRQDLYETQTRLSYAIGAVMALLNTKNLGDSILNIEELSNINTIIQELDNEVLKIGDILVANYNETYNNTAILGLTSLGMTILNKT